MKKEKKNIKNKQEKKPQSFEIETQLIGNTLNKKKCMCFFLCSFPISIEKIKIQNS